MTTFYFDLETRSATPLKAGAPRYMEGAEIIVLAYAMDDAPVQVVTDPKCMREVFLQSRADEYVVHNIGFDYTAMRLILPDVCPQLSKWRCTMAQALAHSLPGSLDSLCAVFNIPQELAKQSNLRYLINTFCKPNKEGGYNDEKSHPEAWATFAYIYGKADVEAMRAIDKKLPKWNNTAMERQIFLLDQTINQRGICIDVHLAERTIEAVEHAKNALAIDVQARTQGRVSSATRRDPLMEYVLEEYGLALPDLKADTIERRLANPETSSELAELLRIRLSATTSSTAKYKTLLNCANTDGRIRGTLQYCGASRTGRWSGRMFQPQNLPRLTLPQEDVDLGIRAALAGAAELVVPDIMKWASNAIRGVVVAPKGKKLVVADLANIEGRYAAWLAGEAWKLKAFREYDAGSGPDLYKLAYARAFNIDPKDVTETQRQIGKVMELMLQYEGGVGAFITGAASYGIDLDQMAAACKPVIPKRVWEDARGFHEWAIEQKRPTFGLDADTFIACDALKRLWRAKHLKITWRWAHLHDAFRSAAGKDAVMIAGVRRHKAWVLNTMPSGRSLSYPGAKVIDGSFTYLGIAPYTYKWSRLKGYGGKYVEQETQAGSRDVMAWAMPRVEQAGYQIVMHVHDEIVTEVPDEPRYNAEHLCELMTQGETWTKGLPLAAKGFETKRYRKG